MELIMKLTKEELQNLEQTKEGKGFFFKEITAEEDGESCTIGILSVSRTSLVNQDLKVETGFFKVELSLGQNHSHPIIVKTLTQVYTVVKEEVDNVVFGEHILINTVNGMRIKVFIQK
ncbi:MULTISPECIES: hypothetical protein [Bacillus cereus group]|uniref:hypothetical protein n=1 Tax=Bacillus cereus group TaxID=86661 RepID=UPI0022DF1AD5|nr:hypothetical protein [Bacillus cereus group sp. TH152-1LC]MDA1675013.1 hypothetical protein [Bacillus cereus group sp. TH152-1LC]